MQAARDRKLAKYEELVKNLKSKKFDLKLESLEVGSRGMLSIAQFSIIDDFSVVTDPEFTRFMNLYVIRRYFALMQYGLEETPVAGTR